MKTVYIAFGSNLGDRRSHIESAKRMLAESGCARIVKESHYYETEAVGGPAGQTPYLNGVWEVQTDLTAGDLLKELFRIEEALGRKRTVKNAPRTIDLDILFYGEDVIDLPGLSVPHPRLHERWFVLKPLEDLNPDLRHPVLRTTVKNLLENLCERNQQS